MVTAKLTALGIAVLELLHERPMHPYEMAQLMRVRSVETRLKLKAGSLYHTVDRLQRNGYVDVVETQRDGRRPERTVYAMTAAGKDAFQERGRQMLGDVVPDYPDVLSGLAVIDELGHDATLAELGNRITRLRAAVASEEVVVARLLADGTPEVYWLDFRYRAAQRTFELAWMEQLYESLDSGRIPFQDKKNRPHLSKEDNASKTG
ncbi:PadR family transcriptional regulator [Amycolatopsis jejuensis]|uniref:PadR family transcriptional regulator n=1 Tax=Amycolatopsis jejuensis TaxID=330084 RepID=UPI000527F20E|nr:PadR family transcriptional regulator [Amycolatopsis jejuensis]